MSDLITVLAASGRQGSAVVRALLDANLPVRAMIRDPTQPDAQRLAFASAELVAGTLDDQDTPR